MLLTSEVSIDPKQLKPGARLRYAEIPVPRYSVGGIFDMTGLDGPARIGKATELAAQTEKCIEKNFGVAFPSFVTKVVKDLPGANRFAKAHVEYFLQQVGVKGNPQERRLATKFAAIYAGGAMAASFMFSGRLSTST